MQLCFNIKKTLVYSVLYTIQYGSARWKNRSLGSGVVLAEGVSKVFPWFTNQHMCWFVNHNNTLCTGEAQAARLKGLNQA